MYLCCYTLLRNYFEFSRPLQESPKPFGVDKGNNGVLRSSPPPPEKKTVIATPSACYRGLKPRNCPKSLGEGATCVLVYVDQKRVALVQNRVALVQETLGRPFLQLVKTPFAPSPNHFGQC